MQTAANFVLVIAGAPMAVEEVLKLVKPNMKTMRMGLVCGGGLAILGVAPV